MTQLKEQHRATSSRSEPAAAIPKFRKLGLSAVVAACAWERKPLNERHEDKKRKPAARSDKG